jgi:hypothetical protein
MVWAFWGRSAWFAFGGCSDVLGHKALLSQLADFLANMLSEFRIPGLFHQASNNFINIFIQTYPFCLISIFRR